MLQCYTTVIKTSYSERHILLHGVSLYFTRAKQARYFYLRQSWVLSDRTHVSYRSIRTFVCCQTCEDDTLRTNQPIVMQTGVRGPQGNGTKRSTSAVRTSRSKSKRADVSSGGQADALFLTNWVGWVCFLVWGFFQSTFIPFTQSRTS